MQVVLNRVSQTIDWSDIVIASPMSENDLPETMEIEETTPFIVLGPEICSERN